MREFTPRVHEVLGYAGAEAERNGHNYLGTEHLLIGLLLDGGGIAAQVLAELGVTERALARVREIMASDGYSRSSNRVIDQEGNDLGFFARDEASGAIRLVREPPQSTPE